MKRLVSLALSAALVLSLLAGCGNSTDPQTTGTATTGGNEGTGEAKDTIDVYKRQTLRGAGSPRFPLPSAAAPYTVQRRRNTINR